MNEWSGKIYTDGKRQIAVVTGLGNRGYFAAELKDGSAYRIVSKYLPIRETFQEAEADLARYAEKKGWVEMTSELLCKQHVFSYAIARLIIEIYHAGKQVSLGDAWARAGHKRGSMHYSRLAVDLNLFEGGRYLDKTEDHLKFGEIWEHWDGVWGGRFEKPDGNHYEWGPGLRVVLL